SKTRSRTPESGTSTHTGSPTLTRARKRITPPPGGPSSVPGRLSRKAPPAKPVTGFWLVGLVGTGIGISPVDGQVCQGAGEGGKSAPGGQAPSAVDTQSIASSSVPGSVDPCEP